MNQRVSQKEEKRKVSPMSATDLDNFLLDNDGENREEPSFGNISGS